MSMPYEFEGLDSDVELENTFEFGDPETEWEDEFGRRRRPARWPARPRAVRRRPPAFRRFARPTLRPRPRIPFRPRPRPRPQFPAILPSWGGWMGQPPMTAPPPGRRRPSLRMVPHRPRNRRMAGRRLAIHLENPGGRWSQRPPSRWSRRMPNRWASPWVSPWSRPRPSPRRTSRRRKSSSRRKCSKPIRSSHSKKSCSKAIRSSHEKELFESYGETPFLGETGPAAQPARLVYRLNPAGCPQGGAAVLRTAIRDAIRFAANAARKLETGDATAARIFQSLFGHPPTRPVPWANNRASGAIVAHRIRRVAQALQGRGTHYRCGCPGRPATVNAFADPPNAVALCARFWQQSRVFRAGIVFHEMLHLLYAGFLRHDQRERRRNNAHCYEAFVLRVAGHTPDPSDVTSVQRPACLGRQEAWRARQATRRRMRSRDR